MAFHVSKPSPTAGFGCLMDKGYAAMILDSTAQPHPYSSPQINLEEVRGDRFAALLADQGVLALLPGLYKMFSLVYRLSLLKENLFSLCFLTQNDA